MPVESSKQVSVRSVSGPAELRACQDVQRRAWGIVDDGYVLPVALMAAAPKVGGLVLGAFWDDDVVGFAFAFLGRLDGALVLYSQLTAVDPQHQGMGVGRLLKLAQRTQAHKAGLAYVAWTFDPLQVGNAAFNMADLGATSHTYEVDLYGPRTDVLNAGLATDRLLVRWPTSGPIGGRNTRWEDALEVIHTEPVDGSHRRVPTTVVTPAGYPHLHVEVPAHMDRVRAASDDAIRDWQEAVRQALRGAFAEGYSVVGFARGARPTYLLERTPRSHALPF